MRRASSRRSSGVRRRAPARRARAAAGVVVLAKYPRPGRVKTRLARAIGSEAACALYRAFVLDLARRLRRQRADLWWAYAPARAPFAALVGSRRCFAQRPGDLGTRIAHALAVVRRHGYGAAIAIGADMPHVSRRALAAAARALARGADVVLGPARDGGYYLIGVRASQPVLFRDVPWGTARVLDVTRRRCRRLGLTLVEVATGFDVDEARDLAPFRGVVQSRPREFPCSRRVLARLAATTSRRQ